MAVLLRMMLRYNEATVQREEKGRSSKELKLNREGVVV